MFRTLFTGANGMKTLALGMQTVSNNIANVNTLGFKREMMVYEDMVSQWAGTGHSMVTSTSQVGNGSACSDIRTMHIQEAFESSNTATDMAINGKGFFGVSDGENTFYTRAGNFRFTADGRLVDPNDYQLMGYPITDGVQGTVARPIQLDASDEGVGTMKAKATGSITNIMNIGVSESAYTDTANPCFAMLSNYDGTQSPPLSEAPYTQPIQVYDSDGNAQTLNMAIDLVDVVNGNRIFEYVVYGNTGSADGGKGQGLAMSGTLTFDSSGQFVDMSAFVPTGDGSDLSQWTQANLSEQGVPQLNIQFGSAAPQTIDFDMGLSASGWAGGASNPAGVGGKPYTNLPGMSGTVRNERITTGYSGSSSSMTLIQDGYAEGSLMNLEVREDGTVRGRYSNGQTDDVFRVPLYSFTSQDGLRREGKNLFSATEDSGEIFEGIAGEEQFGTVHGNAIEMSNVDLANEFVTMIITQRGFQANSKSMMTADTMLQKAMELKR